MFIASDNAYIATKDYHNGAWRWKAGQFVVLSEPEFLRVLESDGMSDALMPLDSGLFLGQGKAVIPSVAKADAKAIAKDAAEHDLPGEHPEPADLEGDAEAPKPEATVAHGRVVGANRMVQPSKTHVRKLGAK